MKQIVIVKYKCINCIRLNYRLDTEDTRYKIKVSKTKLVKWLIKNNFRFSVGINGNALIDNLDYVEVWSNLFTAEDYCEKNELMRKFLNKYSVKRR